VNIFVRNLNKFFAGSKVAHFNLRAGFTIKSGIGDPLELDMLSSGEKQLLLLLCNTLASRDRASILIIDEPEISLNIKWQRRLIKALLDCIKGSNVQLIFATHSIELLAQHRHQVVKLENLEKPSKEKPELDGDHDERRSEDDSRVGSEV
jgi:predicted ATP-dependent endonuclease of OLD family